MQQKAGVVNAGCPQRGIPAIAGALRAAGLGSFSFGVLALAARIALAARVRAIMLLL
jgi:hypothetical protein